MRRLGTILVTISVVVALLAAPFGVAAAVTEQNVGNATEPLAPGERLGGVLGVQRAAIDGDLDDRTYQVRIERAETDEERAAIVDERLSEIDRRLAAHERRLAELQAARKAGNVTNGTYQARIATIAAERANTERAAMRAERTAGRLPDNVLADRGIDVASIRQRRADASRLGGSEIAGSVRSVTGRNVTGPAERERHNGPPQTASSGNETTTSGPDQARGLDQATDRRTRNGTLDSPTRDASDGDHRHHDGEPHRGATGPHRGATGSENGTPQTASSTEQGTAAANRGR